jgi:hypothetical protein
VLVVEDVADEGEGIRVIARPRDVPVPCPVCGVPTGKVHGYHVRTVADVPVDGRQVVGPCPGTAPGLPGPGLPAADLPRASPWADRAPPAPHHATDQPGLGGGQGVMRPGRLPSHPVPGHAPLLRHRPAPAAAHHPADSARPTGDRGRRLRPAPPPPLRHDHHRCRDRGARRCPARPRGRHIGGMAAREEGGRGRVPGWLGHICRGDPPGTARRGAGQRPMASVAEPVRQGPGRSEGPRPLLGHRQPAPAWRPPRADHPRAPAQSPRPPRLRRRPGSTAPAD